MGESRKSVILMERGSGSFPVWMEKMFPLGMNESSCFLASHKEPAVVIISFIILSSLHYWVMLSQVNTVFFCQSLAPWYLYTWPLMTGPAQGYWTRKMGQVVELSSQSRPVDLVCCHALCWWASPLCCLQTPRHKFSSPRCLVAPVPPVSIKVFVLLGRSAQKSSGSGEVAWELPARLRRLASKLVRLPTWSPFPECCQEYDLFLGSILRSNQIWTLL